jgi:hypothetical protein
MPTVVQRMRLALLSADLSTGTVNNVPLSTMYALETRGLITDEWRKQWSMPKSFAHHSGRLTESGMELARSLREKG